MICLRFIKKMRRLFTKSFPLNLFVKNVLVILWPIFLNLFQQIKLFLNHVPANNSCLVDSTVPSHSFLKMLLTMHIQSRRPDATAITFTSPRSHLAQGIPCAWPGILNVHAAAITFIQRFTWYCNSRHQDECDRRCMYI